MRIRDKLRRARAGAGGTDELRSLLRRRAGRLRRTCAPVELPPGEDLHNERGTCYLRRERVGLFARHGAISLGSVLRIRREPLAELARADAVELFDPRRWLFLDTETTGLAGGAGTLVFLCGLGYFDGDAFVLEQVLMRSHGEEPALLAHVARRLREHPVQVTFVGKSFDRHRLAARMSIHGIPAPILDDRHLDLYHLARRRFGSGLPDCKLRTLEEHVLDVHRRDDLPGAEAPAAFWAWMRDRSGPLDEVVEHNRQDVLSLVTLLARLGEATG